MQAIDEMPPVGRLCLCESSHARCARLPCDMPIPPDRRVRSNPCPASTLATGDWRSDDKLNPKASLRKMVCAIGASLVISDFAVRSCYSCLASSVSKLILIFGDCRYMRLPVALLCSCVLLLKLCARNAASRLLYGDRCRCMAQGISQNSYSKELLSLCDLHHRFLLPPG